MSSQGYWTQCPVNLNHSEDRRGRFIGSEPNFLLLKTTQWYKKFPKFSQHRPKPFLPTQLIGKPVWTPVNPACQAKKTALVRVAAIMRIRPRFKNTGISFEGVCLCLYVWNPFFCFSLFWPTYAPLHRHQTAHMGLEEDRCVAQGHFQQILADKDALKSSILQSKGHPAACKCVWPPLRNVEYLSTRESFVCVFACACKSPAPFTQLGGSPSHVSHYRLADNVIGDTKQSVAFRPDKSDKYTPHICFKDVWRWLPLATNKEVRRRNGKEEGGEDCWIKKKHICPHLSLI